MVGLQQKAPVLPVRQKCTEWEKANPFNDYLVFLCLLKKSLNSFTIAS